VRDVLARTPRPFIGGHPEPAGVVHEDIDAAERLPGVRQKALECIGLPHIANLGVHPDAGLTQLGLGATHSVLASRADGDVHAFSREPQCDRPADSPARGGNNGVLALQLQVHGVGGWWLVVGGLNAKPTTDRARTTSNYEPPTHEPRTTNRY